MSVSFFCTILQDKLFVHTQRHVKLDISFFGSHKKCSTQLRILVVFKIPILPFVSHCEHGKENYQWERLKTIQHHLRHCTGKYETTHFRSNCIHWMNLRDDALIPRFVCGKWFFKGEQIGTEIASGMRYRLICAWSSSLAISSVKNDA